MIYDFITIGAGASGLFFAASPAFAGENIKGLILEKTKRPGTKLLMSGSGQCNITHSGSIKEFVEFYGPSGRKIRSVLYKYSNDKLIEFLESNGIKTVCREDGKIFPESMKARDVLDMLLRRCRTNGFTIKTESEVTEISQNAEGCWTVKAGNEVYMAKKLIVSSGGCSYPTTGSDGSMFKVLAEIPEIEITALKPALSPIRVRDYSYTELSGISFQKARVRIHPKDGGKMKAELTDALLFTHSELSGPAVLNISKYAETDDTIEINYLHPLKYEDVLSVLKKKTSGSNADLHNIISDNFAVPKRFAKAISDKYGPSIKSIAQALTGERMTIKSVAGYSTAMATSGGVSLPQLNLKTFEHKTLTGLYIIGEACDIDGATGGYNLQFAFSSAWAAANDLTT